MNTTYLDQITSIVTKKWIKITATIFLSLYFTLWAISSPLSKHLIKPILHEHGLTLSADTSIRYNPFLSQLTISDLTLYKQQQSPIKEAQTKVLAIKELTLRLTLFRFLFDEIFISKFALNDAYLKIEKTPSQLTIAGFNINDEETESNNEKTIESEPTPFLYQVILPKLTFQQIHIDVNNNDKPHQINIEKLLISQLKANEKAQQVTLNLNSFVDKTALLLSLDANFVQGHGEINSQLSITGYPLKRLQGYVNDLSELSGSLSFTSEQQLIIAPEQFKLHITQAKLNSDNLVIGHQQQFFNLKKLENSINDLMLTINQGEITELSGVSQLMLSQAEVYHENPSQKLAYFEQLTLHDISFHFIEYPQVKIANLVIDNMYGSKNEATDLPPLVTLKQLNISDILINEQQLSINKIILDSLQSDVILNKEKVLANLVTLPITETEQENIDKITTAIDQQANSQKTDFIFSLNEFSLINDNLISLLDNSIEPVYQRKLYIDTLYLGAISNAHDKQTQQTPFELIGRSNKYAHFNFSGYTIPFAQQPSHYLKGFLKELSLPAVSVYMKQAMQMELKSGQLNTDIEVTLTGEQLDGNVVLLLQGLETAIADSDEAGALIDQGALPFNIALGMLKDSKGDVELDVPLSGSTSDPSFGMSSIVTLITQKAIWMATQDYLMTTFVPYANIVSVVMTVGEFALKLRFDDLNYQTKQIEPNENQQAYLNDFISLMQDKEDTRVNICAVSIPADIDLTLGNQIANKKQIYQLKDIGTQREEAFKEYIIKHGNIASSRLLLCAPKIDSSENAQPRIELSV